ncbi:hypothetical protein MMC25_007454 [Agyrium rufum]|nr:hypothetical protein [Agyrium rufum]
MFKPLNFLLGITLLPLVVQAGNIVVKNHCTFTTYFQLIQQDGTTIASGSLASTSGSVSFPIQTTGSYTVALGTTSTVSPRIRFDYTVSGSNLFYDLSTVNGNPFTGHTVSALDVRSGGGSSCPHVACPGATCTTTTQSETKSCATGSYDFDVTLCS